MKVKSLATLGGVAFLSILALAGCGNSATSQKKDVLHWQESSDIPTMDLSKATDVVSNETLNGTNEGLLRMAGKSKVVPGVAKNYKISKDGKTWTFNLRHSKWSDGSAVTAQDFVYSWQRTLAPKTASEYAYIFAGIKNATKVNTGKVSGSKLGVKADGKYKLVVTLAKPQSYFKYLVSNSEFFPQKQAAVKKFGDKYGTTSKANLYNGPFVLKGWTGTNDSWQMVKNNKYWNKKNVKADEVKVSVVKDPSTALNLYQSKKLDATTLTGTQVKQYKNNKDYKLYKSASTFYLEMNQKKNKALQNRNIRKALSLTVNRKQFVNKVLADGSTAPKGLVSSATAYRNGKDFADQAYVKSGVDNNVTEAKKYWAKGLKQVGKKNLTLGLMSDDTPAGKETTEFLQSQFTKLPGLKINNQNLPFKTRLARSSSGNFDLVVSGWIADYPDPFSFLELFKSTQSYNDGKWNNKQYNQLINKASGADANKPAARWNDMVKAEKVLMNDQGIIPLYQQGISKLVRSNVSGIQNFPTAPQWDWSKVVVK